MNNKISPPRTKPTDLRRSSSKVKPVIKYNAIYNLMRRCPHFERFESSYVIYIKNLIKLIKSDLTSAGLTYEHFYEKFLERFNKKFSARKLMKNGDDFSKYCEQCGKTFDKVFKIVTLRNDINNVFICYEKIADKVEYIVEKDGKLYILYISYYNKVETQNNLDFYAIKSYIYNKSYGSELDTIVVSLPSDTFFVLYYDHDHISGDMLFKHYSLIKNPINTNVRIPGHWCKYCKNKCNAKIIESSRRFEELIL